MAIRDTEAFIRQRATLFDSNLDATPGSPFDVKVIQPLVRRLGQDPFTVDLTTFINDRLVQAFPELATKEGDAITDLLNKPASIIWDPIVRENRRVQRALSFRDPESLTLEEADALGANLFTERRTGDRARGVGRILFTTPQNISISPVNFVTAKNGKHFFPLQTQSIRVAEMILNQNSEGLYYFDVNLVAEAEGLEYNIGPNELVSIANVPAAVRVQNTRRFRSGRTAETAVEFVGRVRQSLSERSLVTLRGIAAKLLDNFPDMSRLNVVGFNDPEMQRDVIRGGGVGEIVVAGVAGIAISDPENKAKTRRFFTSEVDFITSIVGDATSWVLTAFGATGPVVLAKDFHVRRVVSANEIDLEEQELVLGSSNVRWTLRKRELTLSNIPGGILFPDSANGTVRVPDGDVHIGGAYDVHVRSTDFEENTLAIANVTDDDPIFSGSDLNITAVLLGTRAVVELGDYVLDTNYTIDDPAYKSFADAELFTYSLQVLEGVDAGNYRILSVEQSTGQPVKLTLDPNPSNLGSGPFRWRLFDSINVDLIEPKETRLSASDLRTVQGSNIVDTTSGTNFDDFGVAEGDVLRVLSGPDAGDYGLTADPLAPSFDKLQVDTPFVHSASSLDYVIFRPNAGQGISRPLVRIKSIELLDASNQPIGSTIPYARPVDVQSRAFQNPSRGIKHDFRDAILGLVSAQQPSWVSVSSGTLDLLIAGAVHTVVFTGGVGTSLANVISEINASILAATGIPQIAVQVGSNRFGIRPVSGGVVAVGGSALTSLFGTNSSAATTSFSTFDIRSADAVDEGGFAALTPLVDLVSHLDVVQVLDGSNIGFYEAPFGVRRNLVTSYPALTGDSDALEVPPQTNLISGFAPEVLRRVQIGTRSIGSARVYFLEPTSFEVDPNSRFSLVTESGTYYFLPDPTLDYTRVPPAPSNDFPTDGQSSTGGTVFSASSQDFIRSLIRPGDKLTISTLPIEGSLALTNPVPSCANKTLVFSLDGGPDRVLTFIRDDVSLAVTDVSRQGVVSQINTAMGETICSLSATNTLVFETTRELVIRSSGTANGPVGGFPGLLGLVAGTGGTRSFITDDQNNQSPHAGDYTIVDVGVLGVGNLTVTPAFPSASPYTSPLTQQTFRVARAGLQRVSSTTMASNKGEAGLYYFDVELVSEGSGDEYNISAGQQLKASGYRSDGYYLTTDDENLTFSPIEPVRLVLSRSILEQGVDDDPFNATQISGQNLQITYERTPLVADVQGYISSDVERVVCSSPLGRHLVPVFVRFDLNYVGGSRESVVIPEVEKHIQDLFPIDPLESSDIQKIVLDRGATFIENPLNLIGIVHGVDRTVSAVRSQNYITAGRLSAFIPDLLNIKRSAT